MRVILTLHNKRKFALLHVNKNTFKNFLYIGVGTFVEEYVTSKTTFGGYRGNNVASR